MNTKPVQPHGGPVPPRTPVVLPPGARVAGRERDGRGWLRPTFIVFAGVVIIAGILVVSIPVKVVTREAVDERRLYEVALTLRDADAWTRGGASIIPGARHRRGKDTWSMGLEHVEFDVYARHLVSLGGPDVIAEKAGSGGNLAAENCSYTAPMAAMLDSRGVEGVMPARCVMFTFNSRNWNNYPESGVLVLWSDWSQPQWLTLEQAGKDWGITAEEWADPAGKLFGKKAPFQHTYE